MLPKAHVASLFAVYEFYQAQRQQVFLIKTTEASSKGRLSPPSNNTFFMLI